MLNGVLLAIIFSCQGFFDLYAKIFLSPLKTEKAV